MAAEIAELASKAKRQRGTAKETKPRKKKVKGYGVDLLRAAAERRMAESSEELAEAHDLEGA